MRVSSVSSGWNAATRMRPCRASTGWPSTSASTSTSGPASSIHGARMKTRAQRLAAVADVEIGLEAAHLAAERVPADADVGEAEVVAVEHDHPGARAEDRRREAAQRLVDAVQAHQPRDRGRLAAGDDQPVEPVELLRQPHLDRLGAEAPQHGRVLAEVPLHGEDADPKRLLHAGSVVSASSPIAPSRREARPSSDEPGSRGTRRRATATQPLIERQRRSSRATTVLCDHSAAK